MNPPSFDGHKSLNKGSFEQTEKSKDFSRFLKRIDEIVHRRPNLEDSP